MEKKLIDLYKEWMETGEIKERKGDHGTGGLCNALPIKYLLSLETLLTPETLGGYWANDLKDPCFTNQQSLYGFNPLRQTIVLLICAIHNEL